MLRHFVAQVPKVRQGPFTLTQVDSSATHTKEKHVVEQGEEWISWPKMNFQKIPTIPKMASFQQTTVFREGWRTITKQLAKSSLCLGLFFLPVFAIRSRVFFSTPAAFAGNEHITYHCWKQKKQVKIYDKKQDNGENPKRSPLSSQSLASGVRPWPPSYQWPSSASPNGWYLRRCWHPNLPGVLGLRLGLRGKKNSVLLDWLVVSTNPSEKYARQMGNLPQFSGWKWKHIWVATT